MTPPPNPPSARAIAATVLGEVLFKGAFTSATLDRELGKYPALDSRERALCTEIVYGVVRTHVDLRRLLMERAPRGIAGGDPRVIVPLLVAVYQLLLLDRVPAHGVVNFTVEHVTSLRGKKVGGFCNAILRGIAREGRLRLEDALRNSCPDWLWQQLRSAVGERAALHLLGIRSPAEGTPSREVTPTCIRFRAGASLPEWTNTGRPGVLVDGALRFTGVGDVRRHPEYGEGGFVVQEEGAMFCAVSLGVREGDKVWDACAGRGQKTSLIAERIGATGELWASDIHQKKLTELKSEFYRLELDPPLTQLADLTQLPEEWPRDFQRILVDAPCTGSGTLRRRPEILLRLKEKDVERMAVQAETMLRSAAECMGDEARLVFVVCSVLKRECEDVVSRVADVLEPLSFDAPEVLRLFPDGAPEAFRLLPSTHGTDGFFLASLRKKRQGMGTLSSSEGV